MALVQFKDVKKYYGPHKAHSGVSLSLDANSQYVVCGASGSGKSTLLYLMGGLDRPTAGSIEVDGRELSSFDDEALAAHRNRFIGFVFQFHFLLSSMNCLDNILLPGRIAGVEIKPLTDFILQLANKLGVDHLLSKYPFELSGGEQQRINIIRAISLRPSLLLCDEPTGNLDSGNSRKVVELLKQMASEFTATLVMVTHDEKIASGFTHRFLLQDGLLN
ncbi:MAG: ABC transporter ATP-binding protein [Halobacteriovoraceae bacterium]|nr:ABC transporter ATP-binding protein [Halobacteriovoraceae bacterium]